LLSVKFYELASNDPEEDTQQYVNIVPRAQGTEPERGLFKSDYMK